MEDGAHLGSFDASAQARYGGSSCISATAVLHDLERYASDFLDGVGDEFARCVQDTERFNALSGFKRLSETN